MPRLLNIKGVSMTTDVALDAIEYFARKERKRLEANRKAQKKFRLKEVIPNR